MVFPVERQPARLPIVLACLLLLTGALAGCVGDDDVDADPTGAGALAAIGCDVPAGTNVTVAHFNADTPLQLTEVEGVQVKTWPFALDAVVPTTLCWVNDTSRVVDLVGMPQGLDDGPEWTVDVKSRIPTDPHAAHRPGVKVPPSVFEVDLKAGASVVQVLNSTGTVMVYPPSNMDQFEMWALLPTEPETYDVAVHKVKLSAKTSGSAAPGEAYDATFSVYAPDLETVQGVVSWDDSADDLEAGAERTNQPDRVRVEVVDPSGAVVEGSTKEAEGRVDEILFSVPILDGDWPKTVEGRGEADAVKNLHAARPVDESTIGEWTIRVTLVSAAGVVPDGSGTLNPATTDEGQSFEVRASFFHTFGEVQGSNQDGSSKVLETVL